MSEAADKIQEILSLEDEMTNEDYETIKDLIAYVEPEEIGRTWRVVQSTISQLFVERRIDFDV
jgi:hypothetical protein